MEKTGSNTIRKAEPKDIQTNTKVSPHKALPARRSAHTSLRAAEARRYALRKSNEW